MNVPAVIKSEDGDNGSPRRSNNVLATAAGEGVEMTYQNQQHPCKTEAGHHHEGLLSMRSSSSSPTAPHHGHSAEEDGDTDIIEVFTFDRNSLKLKCEEISPKQRKAAAVATSKQNGLKKDTSTPTTSSAKVKTEPKSSSSSSSSSCSSSSSSDSEDSSSSSSGSSSSSSSSSSNSSASCSSKTTSAATGSSSTSTSSKKLQKKKDSSSSSSSSSSDGSSSSSTETENASDYEDELKKPKILKKIKRQTPSLESSGLKMETKKAGDLSKNNGSFSNTLAATVPMILPTSAAAHIKMEREEDDDGEEEAIPSSSGEILKVEREDDEDGDEEEEEEDELGNGMVNIDNLVEGRNKQRKNSKWGDYVGARKSSRLPPRTSISNKNYEAQLKKRLRGLLKKPTSEWTDDDRSTMQSFPKLVSEVEKRLQKKEVASERLKESEDPPELLERKCAQLASVISRASYLIIYTGAGISTSAKIPDYRGPNGIWTLLQKGEQVTQSLTDISQTADPTLTHMAIKTLYDHQICKHIVSQNVDGLHLRSGIPKVALSEVHGNMYVEACTKCGREFVRLFDVTENTRRHHHKTGRFCYHCGTPLRDTVVLFGEKGSLRWPLNWQGAEYNVDKADVILCLGSSLKVLRRYPWLWSMAKPPQKRPKLYIVNLQWTPKDQFASLKINGKCDQVLEKVMSYLNVPIPQYSRETDSIFTVATHLHLMEKQTKSSSELWYPTDIPYPEKNKDLRNYIRFEPVFKVPIPYEQNVQKFERIEDPADGMVKIEGDEQEVEMDEEAAAALQALKQEREEQAKQRKRVLKGNNFSWLGNTVISKLQKKRKLK